MNWTSSEINWTVLKINWTLTILNILNILNRLNELYLRNAIDYNPLRYEFSNFKKGEKMRGRKIRQHIATYPYSAT